MTAPAEVKPLVPGYVEAWPPHDTEESVLGSDLHQATITNLRLGINEAARLGLPSGAPVPWHARSQTALLGCFRPDGSTLRTYPDIFVYAGPADPLRGSISIFADGPPLLVIEVLSEATFESDSDISRGKGWSYAQAGVLEYLTLDPTGGLVPEHGRGWRLDEGGYTVDWDCEADGKWHCQGLPVAFGFEGAMVAVFTDNGRRLLREGEIEEAIEARDEVIARQAQEIHELERKLRRRP